ncbi:MAG: S9 family peptidase [Acidobacteria bacterium]|nr:S9 family peptidase [Acidobacteriota bacterium]
MSCLSTVTVLVCLGAAALSAARKPVTLEVAAEDRRPRAGEVQWAPDSKSFVWKESGKLWLFELASKSKKELVSFEALEKAALKPPPAEAFDWENRRVKDQKIQWAGDGKGLLLLVNGDLFWLDPGSLQWEQLTATGTPERDPKLSPDARRISFRRGNELYVLERGSKKVTRLTHDATATVWNGRLDWIYPEELDLGTAHWWSPDSSRIAWLQFDVSRQYIYPHADLTGVGAIFEPERYPKAGTPNADVRLGVVAATGGAARWMDLGEPRDQLLARVAWLPDSSALALQRTNRVQNRLDLLLADPATGAARPILRETGRAWVNVSDDMALLKDGRRLVWSSERDGWKHLYLCTLDGKSVKQLTRGEWMVESLAGVDEQARLVYYVSTEESPLERHLYRVDFNGKRREKLTRGAGVHSVSMSPDARYYIDTFSSLTEPSSRKIRSSDGSEWAVFREADRKVADEYEILPAEIVKVKAADGTLLYARLIRPAGFDPAKKYPAIVMVYGGPHSQSVRNSWAGATFDQALAHRGFVIWQLDNRGSSGRGHAWEAKLYRRFGKQELEDQEAGVRHLISLGFVDARRLGIHGWSYGGYMTLYSLLNAPDLFRAGVAGAPVTDWHLYDTIYTERYLGLPSENEEGYRLSSPVNQAARLKGKLMLAHNLGDDNVLFQNTFRMMNALTRAGKQFELRIYPQKTHGVTGPERKHMLEAIAAFFEQHLKMATDPD